MKVTIILNLIEKKKNARIYIGVMAFRVHWSALEPTFCLNLTTLFDTEQR